MKRGSVFAEPLFFGGTVGRKWELSRWKIIEKRGSGIWRGISKSVILKISRGVDFENFCISTLCKAVRRQSFSVVDSSFMEQRFHMLSWFIIIFRLFLLHLTWQSTFPRFWFFYPMAKFSDYYDTSLIKPQSCKKITSGFVGLSMICYRLEKESKTCLGECQLRERIGKLL